MRLVILILSLLLPGLLATPGYVATLKAPFPTHRQASVTINGAFVEVLFHNATVVAFRVPDKFRDDPALLATAVVKIRTKKTINLPLIVIKNAIVKVDVDELRERLRLEHEHSRRKGGKIHRERQSDNHEEINPENVDEEPDEFADDEPDELETEGDDEEDSELASDEATTEAMEEEDATKKSEQSAGEEKWSEIDEWDARLAAVESQLEEHDVPKTAMDVLQSAVNAGSARAEVTLASLLLSGRQGLKRDHSVAVGLLRSAAGKGHPDAQALLGFFHASGIVPNVARDIGAAVLMWTFAAEGGSNFAKISLAYRYFTGTDVAENCEKAAYYYRDVARDVFRDSRRNLAGQRIDRKEGDELEVEILPPLPRSSLGSDRVRLSDSKRREIIGEANDHVQYERLSADRGDAGAQLRLGQLYYYGAYQIPRNIPKAQRLFQAAAVEELPLAYAHLGLIDLEAGRNESAAQFLLKAAEGKDKLGLNGMGYITFHGIGVKRDPKKAAEFFYEAAKGDQPDAMYNLALMYIHGVRGSQSMTEARKLFQQAAHRFSHVPSSYILGEQALQGMHSGDAECPEAIRYLELVAQRGVWNKILSKALRAYEKGAYADALYRYLMAAHAGIELAQFNAAFMYEKKKISNPDGFIIGPSNGEKPTRGAVVEEALQLYSMSASQNSDRSLVRMGDLAFGEGKDYTRAALAYERATNLDNAEAMFNLGWMYARGLGRTPDRHMAKRFFDRAKSSDTNAAIPATIAVHALQFPEQFFVFLDKAVLMVDRCRELLSLAWEGEVGGENIAGTFEIVDAILLTGLLGILVVVINARQRRMVQANNDVREEGIEGHDAGNQQDDAPAPQYREQPNQEGQAQGENRQAQQEPQQDPQQER